jgi:uncharacterized protein (UPF0332 family)
LVEQRKNLVLYRLQNAQEKLESAQILLENGNYKDSASRSYYAMFTGIRAILAKDGIDYSKHSGVIAYFQKEYIKTGIFEKKYSKYIQNSFQIRNSSDYDDFYIISVTEAQEQIQKAEELLEAIKKYLEEILDKEEKEES